MVFAVSFSLLQSSLTQSESEEHASPVSSAALDGPKQEFRGCLIHAIRSQSRAKT